MRTFVLCLFTATLAVACATEESPSELAQQGAALTGDSGDSFDDADQADGRAANGTTEVIPLLPVESSPSECARPPAHVTNQKPGPVKPLKPWERPEFANDRAMQRVEAMSRAIGPRAMTAAERANASAAWRPKSPAQKKRARRSSTSLDPDESAKRAAHGQALRDYINWLQANPGATPAERAAQKRSLLATATSGGTP